MISRQEDMDRGRPLRPAPSLRLLTTEETSPERTSQPARRRARGPATIGHVLSPAPRDAWEEVLRSDPFALETQSPAWTDAMQAAGGFEDASRLYETRDGRLLVLPMVRRSRLRRAAVIEGSNPPGWGVGGLLAPSGATPEEVAAVFADLAKRRILAQRLWPNPLMAQAWASGAPARARVTPRVAHLLDLEGGFEHVWSKRFQSSSRRGARHAERTGVTVESDASGRLVPEFSALRSQAVARWSRLQHEPLWLAMRRHQRQDGPRKMAAIADALGDRCRIWLARVEGRPAAAMMVFTGTNAYDFRAAMDESLRSYRANDLLLRLAIEQACEDGCRYYYMGDSGRSASLGKFKERFGARPYDYAEYRLERLPLTAAEEGLKRAVKRVIRFKDS